MKYRTFDYAARLSITLVIGAFALPMLDADQTLPATTVAAGDVNQTEAILWAHSFNLGPVVFEVSTDPAFSTGVSSVSATATDGLVPVKISFTGLSAATTYYYRATTSGDSSSGTFRTAAPVGVLAGVHFGISGDERGELAPFPSISNAAEKNLDFFVQFGDNIYADFASPDLPQPQARSLSDFRIKSNEVYSPRYGLNTFGVLRSSTAILATIDDHEVADNFAGAALRTSDARFAADTGALISDTETFNNGIQAFREYHPVKQINYGATGDVTTAFRAKQYRFNSYGRDAATFLLDARTFRSDHLTPITNPNDPAQVTTFLIDAFTPGRTLLGAAQLAELKHDLLDAQANGTVWKFLLCPEPVQNFGPLGGEDRYEGYAAERTNLLKFIDDNHIQNVVFVTADFHGTTVNRLSYQMGPGQPQIQTNSIEIITGPVAFDKPFGPTIVDIATAVGLVSPAQNVFYNSLPTGAVKESFVISVVNGGLSTLGYNLLSLTTNPLPNVHLLNGFYTATSSYGWTEFTVDPTSQQLNVRTWGIPLYSQTQLDSDPAAITSRIPAVVSEFVMTPAPILNAAAQADLKVRYNGTAIDLVSATAAAPASGTFAGAGVTENVFDPSAVPPGKQTITYSVVDAFGSTQSTTFTIDVQSVSFLGVSAGDVTTTDATIWTRAVDDAASTSVLTLVAQVSSDPTFSVGVSTFHETTDSAKDYTAKIDLSGLQPATVYYYRFVGPNSETSEVGKFKTAPLSTEKAPVHFAFSGDMDGLMRPYVLASTIPAQNFDFYVNLGDVIYETASNVAGNTGASSLNSLAVTLSGNIPAPSSTGATPAQLYGDYSRKYREQFLPVNKGGQSSLKDFYAAQGNYTLYDNHELGNRQYINGGAPAGGPVGGVLTGAGVDARLTINDINPSGPFINKSAGFQTLQQVYFDYQPIADRGVINVPADPRTDQTRQLFFAQQWGKNAIFINLDDRSYRDIRIKTAANADDTGTRADAPNRTMLGATQLAWLEQTLLDAQNAATPWIFVALSSPIDQLGPLGSALNLDNLPNFGPGSSYSPVLTDTGKSWQGGYRAERNALLKFIADHQINNVVFLSTDDHQNRVNELTYSLTGETGVQSTYVKVPYCFEIVAGPLGATGPDLITNHTFAMAQQLAASIATAQTTAGIEPLGLQGYPGLKNVFRENDPNAATSPTAVDFYSPDTFNYNILDVSADGKTLTVTSIGLNATLQNSALEYGANGNTARQLFSFQIDAGPAASEVHVTLGRIVPNQRTGHLVQQVSVRNDGAVPLIGPIYLALDQLSSVAALANGTGMTVNNAPVGSAYIKLSNTDLAPGRTTNIALEFTTLLDGATINYHPRLVTGSMNP